MPSRYLNVCSSWIGRGVSDIMSARLCKTVDACALRAMVGIDHLVSSGWAAIPS